MKALFVLLLVAACSAPTPVDTQGNVAPWRAGKRASGSLSGQGGAPVTSVSGVVDPTNAAFAGGMVPCAAACSAGVLEQNRAALQSAITAAVAQRRNVYIPPGTYPIGRRAASSYAIDFGTSPDVYIDGLGVTLRQAGDATSTDYAMFLIHNTSQVRLRGITFSQRDVVNATARTTAILIGDGGTTTVDNVLIEDCAFIEGVGGDYVQLDGGTTAETVTQVILTRSRFENSARAAVDVRTGARQVIITYSFFRNNVNRDIYFEPQGGNVTGRFEIVGNTMERASSTTAASVTLSGFSPSATQGQSHFRYNRISDGIIEGSNLASTYIEANFLEYGRNLGSSANIDLSGFVSDVWVVDNYINRKTGATDGSLIRATSTTANAPVNLQIRGNRGYQFSGVSSGIDLSGSSRFNVLENKISYHAATPDSGSTGFAGIYCAGSVSVPCSGVIARNSIKRDDQDIRASLSLSTVTTHATTVVEAIQIGTAGNALVLKFLDDAVTTAGTLTEAGLLTTVHYRPGFTTVTAMETLIDLNSSVFRVRTPGAAATLQATVDAFASASPTGGMQSGRMLTGIQVAVGSGSTINRMTIRDNVVDGAASAYFIDGSGTSAFPEGFPIISGTFRLNGTAELAGGIATYRTESTSDAETLTSGALSVSKHIAFLSTSGTVNYTLADGLSDGFTKCVRIKAATSSPIGVLTPAHMADGTSHTLSWTSTGGSFCLVWDATSSTYRVTGPLTNVTLN